LKIKFSVDILSTLSVVPGLYIVVQLLNSYLSSAPMQALFVRWGVWFANGCAEL